MPDLQPDLATPETGAIADPTPIYVNESYEGESFGSADEWSQKVAEWELKEPEPGGFLASVRGVLEKVTARRIGRQVSEQLDLDEEIRNDKWKHCIVGAEIARTTSFSTAEYAAWFKEHQDLTDGVSSTFFEEDDYKAAVDGARQTTQEQCEDCSAVCEERWGDRDKSWEGTRPGSASE